MNEPNIRTCYADNGAVIIENHIDFDAPDDDPHAVLVGRSFAEYAEAALAGGRDVVLEWRNPLTERWEVAGTALHDTCGHVHYRQHKRVFPRDTQHP